MTLQPEDVIVVAIVAIVTSHTLSAWLMLTVLKCLLS